MLDVAIRPAIAPVECMPEPLDDEASGRGRLLVATAVLSGTVLLSGCTSEAPAQTPAAPTTDPSASAAPELPSLDTLTDPTPTKYPRYNILNTTYLSSAVKSGIADKKIPDYVEYGQEDNTVGFPSTESVPLFTVVMGSDGKLHYQDQTGGIVTPEQEKMLLESVEANGQLVLGLMKAQKLHSVRFRLFKSYDTGDPSLEETSYPMFVPSDPLDNGAPNIYAYLPADALLDEESAATRLSHELTHNLLQQGMPGGEISEDDARIIAQACDTLSHSALREASQGAQDIVEKLQYVRDHTDRRYRSSFNAVITALRNGTYDTLPKESSSTEIPSCYIQHPIMAVATYARSKGIDWTPFGDQAAASGEFGDIVSTLADDWRALLNEITVYRYMREATYLRPSEDTQGFGHPQDKSAETTTSAADIAFKFPKEVADHVTYDMTPAERKAFNDIVASDVAHARRLYAGIPDMLNFVNERYDAYLAACAAA